VFENDGAGALRYVYHESLIPVDCGNVILADLDGDQRRDLVYCGVTRIFHTNCSDSIDRNKKGPPKNKFPTPVAGTLRVPCAGYDIHRVPTILQIRKLFFGPF
jgi:hypothetical protein